MTTPAFTTVSARRTLGGSHFPRSTPPVSVQASQPSQPRKIDWPASVREYVQRSFATENAVVGITQEDMSSKLKQVINQAAERNALTEIDWSTFPLPQQILCNERIASAKTAAHMAPWQESIAEMKIEDKNIPLTNQPINSKKRKSSDAVTGADLSHDPKQLPPWHQTTSRNAFENRITFPTPTPMQSKRAEKRRKAEESFAKDPSKLTGDLEKRKQRFEIGRPAYPSPPHNSSRDDTPLADAAEGPVIGICQNLEKNYFRLTAPPKPEVVRPLPVLKQTFDLLKRKWKETNNYSYICDQLKSMRQDLTVQHIKTEFTVNVYELHARIALEKNDLGEYNQCQTQLRALYKQKLGGHPAEFLAYRILYFLHTCNRTDMNEVLADMTPEDREEPALKHALSVRSALASGNYHRFFQLFQVTPYMGGYLIDMFLTRERLAALAALCRAYKPSVPLRFVCEELGFESDQECAAFICNCRGDDLLEAGPSGVIFASGKAGQLFEQGKIAAFKRVDIKGQL